MTTNATKTAKSAEANTIELGRVQISEPELESDRNVTLEFQIPARIYLYGRRNLKEYEKITLEHLRIQSSVFFEITEFLSYLANVECGRSPEELLEYINILSYFAKGFSETSEVVQMEFERNRKNESEAAERIFAAPKVEQPVESQELDKLAVQISELLNNPALPVEVYNAILHGTDDIINSSNSADNARYETSPEHIKAVLKISKS